MIAENTYDRCEIIGNATLYHGDSTLILPQLSEESVDIIWTDPPYGNNNNDGDLANNREKALGIFVPEERTQSRPILNDGREEMREVVGKILIYGARVLKKESVCCVCCGGGGPNTTFAWLAQQMDTNGLQFFQAIVWDKMGLGMGWRYRRNYEFVMIAIRKGGKLKWETKRMDAITANVVRIPKIIPQQDDHPTPKPVELISHFLMLHGKPGDLVLDPFMGHGPVGVAAINADMRYIGIELDREHFDVACDRIDKAQRQFRLAI